MCAYHYRYNYRYNYKIEKAINEYKYRHIRVDVYVPRSFGVHLAYRVYSYLKRAVNRAWTNDVYMGTPLEDVASVAYLRVQFSMAPKT